MKKIEMKNIKEVWLCLNNGTEIQRTDEIEKSALPDVIEDEIEIIDSLDRWFYEDYKDNVIIGFDIVIEFVTNDDDKILCPMNHRTLIRVIESKKTIKKFYGDYEDYIDEIEIVMNRSNNYSDDEIKAMIEAYSDKYDPDNYYCKFDNYEIKIEVE